jgi:hypothetical protein
MFQTQNTYLSIIYYVTASMFRVGNDLAAG